MLTKYKSNAEGHARILVHLAENDEITKDAYYKGQSLYAKAKAEFDGLIDQLVFEIEFGAKQTSYPFHEAFGEKAKAKSDAFERYVQKQFPGSQNGTRGLVADELKKVFEVIAASFSKKSFTEQTASIKMLEEYKWPEFHTIVESQR